MVEGVTDGASVEGVIDGAPVEGAMVEVDMVEGVTDGASIEGVTDGAIACTVHTPNRYNNLINTV